LADTTGNLKITREVELKRGPSKESETIGLLPINTLAQDRKAKLGQFKRVGVELQNGEIVDGWVPADSVVKHRPKRSTSSDDSDSDDPADGAASNSDSDSASKSTNGDKSAAPSKNGKVVIPQDESIVMHRAPSFFYGIQGGANLGIIQEATNGAYYYGIGFIGGGYIGLFLDRDIPVRLEINLTQVNAVGTLSAGGTAGLGFNYIEAGLVPAYRFGNFEVFGGITYSLGIGIGYVPPNISLPDGATDMSSLGAEAGVGYRFQINPDFFLAIRARFLFDFLRSPFANQSAGLMVAFEFQG
jgi:hypothetical protein